MPKAEKAKKTSTSRKEKQIHPNSRKAARLSKSMHRDDRMQKRKEDHDAKQSALRDKVLWFKSQLDESKEKYSLSEVSEVITRYISRFDERLKEIEETNKFNKEKGRHGRYHASEEEAIKMVVEREQQNFIAGTFEAPDLTNRSNLKVLKNWDGETKGLPAIKLRKYKDQSLLNMNNDDVTKVNIDDVTDMEEDKVI